MRWSWLVHPRSKYLLGSLAKLIRQSFFLRAEGQAGALTFERSSTELKRNRMNLN